MHLLTSEDNIRYLLIDKRNCNYQRIYYIIIKLRMGRRNKGRGSTKKKRGGKSKQRSTQTKNNEEGASDTTIAPHTSVVPPKERPSIRFNVGDRVECLIEVGTWQSGTIIKRHTMGWDGKMYHPYGIRLDNGEVVYAPVDEDTTIKKSLDARKFNDFKIGTRVEYLRNGNWTSGTILRCDLDWVNVDPLEGSPYSIRFDGEDNTLYLWGPRDSFREIQSATSCVNNSELFTLSNELKTLRFNVEDRVECCVGDGRWLPGTIIKTHYKEPSFEAGFTAPYQIQLDIGNRIYAPLDEDNYIMKIDSAKPTCWICFDDEQSEKNPIVRECACRGDDNGYVHTQCIAKFAITKAANSLDHREGIDDQNPFTRCITCKQEFKKGSWSFSALASGLFYAFGSKDKIGCPWNGIATSMFAHSLMTESRVKAEAFLIKRCKMITGLQGRTSQLDLDLSRFFGDLALVYEEMGELDNMKGALDCALSLVEELENGSHSHRKINILSSLATHAYLTGNSNDALGQYEKCIRLIRSKTATNDMLLATLLIKRGNLDLELGNTERGIEQITESVDIMKVVYGCDHDVVSKLSGCLDKIREGDLEMIPKKLMGLQFSSLPGCGVFD